MDFTLTLDTNCLLAVVEGRPEALAIRTLIAAHRSRRANVPLQQSLLPNVNRIKWSCSCNLLERVLFANRSGVLYGQKCADQAPMQIGLNTVGDLYE
jgi:hypothetical protein